MKLSVFWNHAVLAAEQQQISMPVMLQKLRCMGFSMLEFG